MANFSAYKIKSVREAANAKSAILFSQKIFSTDYKSQADISVFVTDYESQSDLKVFKVDYQSQAKDNKGFLQSSENYFSDFLSSESSTSSNKIFIIFSLLENSFIVARWLYTNQFLRRVLVSQYI